MEELLSSAGIISLISLTFMEVVLGIDNIIFVSIIAGRVEKKDQKNDLFTKIEIFQQG